MKQPRFRLFERPVCSKPGCVWPEANNPGNNTDRSKNDGRLIKNLGFPFLYRPISNRFHIVRDLIVKLLGRKKMNVLGLVFEVKRSEFIR